MMDRSEGGKPARDRTLRITGDQTGTSFLVVSSATISCLIQAFRQRGYSVEEMDGCPGSSNTSLGTDESGTILVMPDLDPPG